MGLQGLVSVTRWLVRAVVLNPGPQVPLRHSLVSYNRFKLFPCSNTNMQDRGVVEDQG